MTATTLKDEIDQFASRYTENELRTAIGELAKKVFAKSGAVAMLTIRDADGKRVGMILPERTMDSPDSNDLQTLLALARHRRDNPAVRYLSVEEFIASLTL